MSTSRVVCKHGPSNLIEVIKSKARSWDASRAGEPPSTHNEHLSGCKRQVRPLALA